VAAAGHVEWRLPVGGFGIPAGRYGRLPASLTLAPYVAAGWASRSLAATPWLPTPEPRITVGVGLELLGLVRVEAGFGTQSRRAHVTFDVSRDFWDIL
jgi:hypothetical protein